MSNLGTYAICPFWETEYRSRIICEGLSDKCSTNVSFRSKADFEEWKNKYCTCFRYPDCPYYQSICKYKYREVDK